MEQAVDIFDVEVHTYMSEQPDVIEDVVYLNFGIQDKEGNVRDKDYLVIRDKWGNVTFYRVDQVFKTKILRDVYKGVEEDWYTEDDSPVMNAYDEELGDN